MSQLHPVCDVADASRDPSTSPPPNGTDLSSYGRSVIVTPNCVTTGDLFFTLLEDLWNVVYQNKAGSLLAVKIGAYYGLRLAPFSLLSSQFVMFCGRLVLPDNIRRRIRRSQKEGIENLSICQGLEKHSEERFPQP